jgi:hypothetical protein
VWERHRYYQPIDFDTRPSDLFRSHFYGCFIDTSTVWRTGTPSVWTASRSKSISQSDSNWPDSRKRAVEVLAQVPDDECKLIVEDNALRMPNFPWVA